MKNTLGQAVRGLASVLFAVVLVGCAPFPSKPSRGERYDEICHYLGIDESEQAPNGDLRAAHSDSLDVFGKRAESDPGVFKDSSAAKDIALARQHLNKVRLDYERFECRKELSNRIYYDRPLLVTAIAAGAAAIVHANAYLIGGVGLAAGGMAAFKTYNQPDKDRDAFLSAYAQLTCAYDETHSLALSQGTDKAKYNRAALELAMATVAGEIGPLTIDGVKLTPAEKATLAAANAALDAAHKAVIAVNQSIADYDRLSTLIYKTTDTVDIIARTASRTNGTYSAFSSEIESAYTAVGQSQNATDQAKQGVMTAGAAEKASESTTAATGTGTKAKTGPEKTAEKLNAQGSADLAQQIRDLLIPTSCNPGQASSACPLAAKGTVPVDVSTGKQLQAWTVGVSVSTGDISKLVQIATIVTENLPTPSYAEIAANVAGCVAK